MYRFTDTYDNVAIFEYPRLRRSPDGFGPMTGTIGDDLRLQRWI